MSSTKANFIERIEVYTNTLASPELISKALTEKEHNEKAKILRNGLAIIGFTILEDFIRKRTGEVFKRITPSAIPFGSLPVKIQEAATWNALKAIQERARIMKGNNDDYVRFVQSETRFVSSTQDSAYEMSEYSLGWEKSNLQTDDVPSFLKTFNIEGGWPALEIVIRNAQMSLSAVDQVFRNAAQRRHSAAHNSSTDSLLSDLTDFSSQVRMIAFSYDVLISKSLTQILNNNVDFLHRNRKVNGNDVAFRFLTYDGTTWKETSQKSNKVIRSKSEYSSIYPDCLNRAKRNKEVIVLRSASNKITDWIIAELL